MKDVFIFSDLYLCSLPKIKEEFNKLNLITIDKKSDVVDVSSEKSLFVSRFCYKGFGGDVVNLLRHNNRKILQYDVGGIDIRVRACPAQYLTSKSENLKIQVSKKFPKQYKNIFVTGTLQYDFAYTTNVVRKDFFDSYGLDPNKKLLVLTTANPGEAWMSGLKEDYKEIFRIVNDMCYGNYQLVLKCHPLDYMSGMPKKPGVIHKGQHYNNKPSWNELFPNITVIKAEEGYKAIKACDAILNVRSSIAMETALFRKPLININRHKYTTNWPFDPKVMMDIDMCELEAVLNTNIYDIDESACIEYCKRENLSDDGMAYYRTADVVEKILKLG
jgi:UDP-N-acetylglucosamine 2-epimerase